MKLISTGLFSFVLAAGCSGGAPSTMAPEVAPEQVRSGPVELAAGPSSLAFRNESGGARVATSPVYGVRVEGDGSWSFRPMLGTNAHKRLPGTPLKLATSIVERGAARAERASVRDGDHAAQVAIDRGLAVERITRRASSVEQTWTFAQKPVDPRPMEAMTGGMVVPTDLVVRVPVSGHDFVSEGSEGVTFRDPATRTLVRYGAATWIDATGERTAVLPRYQDGAIVMTLPASVVESSQYPAVLDPTVSGAIAVDSQGPSAATSPGVAYDPVHDTFLVAWVDTNNTNKIGVVQRVNGAGTLVGSNTQIVAQGTDVLFIDAIYDGTNFQVIWETDESDESPILGRRMDSNGNWVDGNVNTFDGSLGYKWGPIRSAVNNAGKVLVTYGYVGGGNQFGTSGTFVYAGASASNRIDIQTVTGAGCNSLREDGRSVASDGINFLVAWDHACAAAPGVAAMTVSNTGVLGSRFSVNNFLPPGPLRVSFGGGNFLVVWEDPRRGAGTSDLYGAIVSPAGSPGSAFAISAPNDGTNSFSPALSFDGNNFLVAYINVIGAPTAAGPVKSKQVSPAGAVVGSVYAGWPGPDNYGLGLAARAGGKQLLAYEASANTRESAVLFTPGINGAPCTTNADCDNGHCVPNMPAGTGSTCCASACTGDNCTAASCATGSCVQTSTSSGACGAYTPCQAAAASCGQPTDVDHDNIPDTWETNNNGSGQHYVDYNCDGTWEPSEPILSGVSTGTPDVFVTYDYMGLGLDDWSCTMDSDCAKLGAYHLGETCVAGKCVFQCTTNGDCATGSGAVCNNNNQCPSGQVCLNDTCQRGPWHAGEQCLTSGSVTVGNQLGTACNGANCGVCYHTHDPEVVAPGALQKVVDAFALRNVKVHITRGNMQPHSHVVSYRADNQMDNLCEGGSAAGGTVGVGNYAVSLYDLKKQSFPPAAAAFMHYGLFSHYVGCDNTTHCTPPVQGGTSDCPYASNPDNTPKNTPAAGMTGLAEIQGNDFVVALGGAVNDSAFIPSILSPAGYSLVGATFMHELGHNLGLRHDGHVDKPCVTNGDCSGGDTCVDINDGLGKVCHEITGGMTGVEQSSYKPNYLSVMSYRYQPNGIQNSSTPNQAVSGAQWTPGSNSPDATMTRIDYSSQTLPTGGPTPGSLVENNLSDTAGLGAAVDGNFPNAYPLFTYKDGLCDSPWKTAPAIGSVDWMTYNVTFNATGQQADVSATVGINTCANNPSTTLSGHADWGNLIYTFQCTSPFADGFSPVDDYPQEPDVPSMSGSPRGTTCNGAPTGCVGPTPPIAGNPSCGATGCANPIPTRVDIRPMAQNNWIIANDTLQTGGPQNVNYTGGTCTVCGGTYGCFSNNTSSFTDPTPAGGVAAGVAIQLTGTDCTNGGTLSLYVNGVFVGTTSQTQNCQCGSCQTYPWVTYFAGLSAMPGYVQGGTNRLQITSSNGQSACLSKAAVWTYYYRSVPVVVYGSPLLDVTQIATNSVTFANALPVLPANTSVDLDHDGYNDLQLTYLDASTNLTSTATSAAVNGNVNLPVGGVIPFTGSDVVQMVSSTQSNVACGSTGYSGANGCWYRSGLGQSCNTACREHGGFNATKSTHTGNAIGKGFFPLKTAGSTWVTVECSSTDNNTDWGANGGAADGTFSNANCYLSCSCNN